MLDKLLKYDLKRLGKELFVGYLVLLAFSILTRIFAILKDISSIFSVPYSTMLFVTILLLVGIILFTYFVSIKNFYKSFYKDEAYLVNTLPVSKNNILLSKIISALIYFCISLTFVVMAFLILFYNTSVFTSIEAMLTQVRLELHINALVMIIIFLIAFAITYLEYLLLVVAACAIGHTFHKDRIGNSIAFGFLLYFCEQIVSLIAIALTMVIDSSLFKVLMNKQEFTLKNTVEILIVSFMIYIIMSIAYYIISKIMLEKKYNLE